MTGEQGAEQPQRRDHGDARVAEPCPSFDTLSAYFDDELPEIEMRAIRTHIATCQNCAPILADFRGIHSVLSDAGNYQLPRAFALNESMIAPASPKRAPAPFTSFIRIATTVRRAPMIPIMTAIAALLLVAVIAAEGWTDGSDSATTDSGTRIVMVGGVAVEVEDDATFGAASAGAMNGGATDADADSGAAQGSRSSTDWFNWWRPFELVLGLTVAALVVTMMSRRRPRHE